MWPLFDLAMFAAGFWVCWLAKERLLQAISGTESYAKALEAKALAAKAAAVKAALR